MKETDIENRLMDMGRGEERVRCMERVTSTLAMGICRMSQETQTKGPGINLEWWNGEEDGREVQEEGDMCTAMVDSYRCMTETNAIL